MPSHVVSEGVANTVLCRDVDPFRSLATEPAPPGFREAWDHAWWWVVCPSWPVAPVDPAASRPVVSDVPTLVLVGGLAAPTPEPVVRANIGGLTHVSVVVAPTFSHNLLGHGCVAALRDDWLEDPRPSSSLPDCIPARLEW